MSKITAIIFSRNRAMQLDLLLKSMQKYAAEMFERAVILYRADNADYERAYGILKQEYAGFAGIEWIREPGEDYFRLDMGITLRDVATEYLCFFCDDNVFFREAPQPIMSSFLGFSWRLGKNTTYCYMMYLNQDANQDAGIGDFAYRFSTDGTVYRTEDVRRWRKAAAEFQNPNSFEVVMNAAIDREKRIGRDLLNYAPHSSLVGIPHNSVTSWPQGNRHAHGSPEALNVAFLMDYRIDLEAMDFSNVIGCHQEIPYKFKKLPSNTGGAGAEAAASDDKAAPPVQSAHAVSSQSEIDSPEKRQQQKPIFSILHPTARLPEGWVKAYAQAKQNADHWEDVEYILCVDDADEAKLPNMSDMPPDVKVEINFNRPCSVAGYNAAAPHASGQIFIHAQDDVFFPPHWDTELLKVVWGEVWSDDVELRDFARWETAPKREFVIHVSSGSPRDPFQMAPQIYSRARYEKLGYAFYPEYLGMYADNEFTEHAYKDQVVIDAKHLLFEQRHPLLGHKDVEYDATYQHENSEESYRLGALILERRRKELGFSQADIPGLAIIPGRAAAIDKTGGGRSPKSIRLFLPGEQFSQTWVERLWALFIGLMKNGHAVDVCFGHISNVYLTRAIFAANVDAGVQTGEAPPADYVLWLDDDNTVTADQVEMLIADLDACPGLAGVGGWCWTQFDGERDGHRISCGTLDDSGRVQPFTHEWMCEQAKEGLTTIDYSGLPCFLMRPQVLRAMGPRAFGPLLAPWIDSGFYGEDVGFFIRAAWGDAEISVASREMFPLPEPSKETRKYLFAVDPRVKVVHLKRSDAEPAGMAWPPAESPETAMLASHGKSGDGRRRVTAETAMYPEDELVSNSF